jgi:hypothetical protein
MNTPEEGEHMKTRKTILASLAAMSLAGATFAQTTSQTERVKGTPKAEVEKKMTGEVVGVEGDWLFAKMHPLGTYSLFRVQPGREFIIDGQTKHIGELKPGTVITGTVTTKTTPVTVRTTATLNGTVRFAQGNFVVLRLENGDLKEYRVPDSYRFVVDGRPASVRQLRPGMNVTATKITEQPETMISTQTSITGTGPTK